MSKDAGQRITAALLAGAEKVRWKPFFDLIGLNENSIEKFVRLLSMHLILDRLLVVVLTVAFTKHHKSFDPKVFDDVFDGVADISLAKRINLAVKLRIISTETGANIHQVNGVRNALVHFKPKRGWSLDQLPELASAIAFEACAKKGRAAMKELQSHLSNLVQ